MIIITTTTSTTITTITTTIFITSKVTKKVDHKHEIRKRISSTMAVLKELDMLRLRVHCSKKWKLTVCNVVSTSKVLCGLETLEPFRALQIC